MHSGASWGVFLDLQFTCLASGTFFLSDTVENSVLPFHASCVCSVLLDHVQISTLTPFSNNLLDILILCTVTCQAVTISTKLLLSMAPRCFIWHLSLLPYCCGSSGRLLIIICYSACLSELQKLPRHSESYQGLGPYGPWCNYATENGSCNCKINDKHVNRRYSSHLIGLSLRHSTANVA